jgi:hypothetical protein
MSDLAIGFHSAIPAATGDPEGAFYPFVNSKSVSFFVGCRFISAAF